MFIAIGGLFVYVIKSVQKSNGNNIETAQQWFIIGGAVYLAILTGMLIRSVIQLELALRKTKEN